jgi:hypothetical protein
VLPPPGDPKAANGGRRGDPPPGQAESKDCPHCSGEGMVTVYHPRPDPARRILPTTCADCVCPRGRAMRGSRKPAELARIVDLEDVLAGGVDWLPDPPASPPPPNGHPAPRRMAAAAAKKFSAE